MSIDYYFNTFLVPKTYTALDGSVTHLGDLLVEYRVTKYRSDGTMRTIDITSIMWGTEEVVGYINACHHEELNELTKAAENNFKSLNNEQ